MKEFPSYVFVLGSSSLNLKLFSFFSPLANYKSMEERIEGKRAERMNIHSLHATPLHSISLHSTSPSVCVCVCAYKPNGHVLMHNMFIYDSISSRSCFHSLQFFLVRFHFLISKAISTVQFALVGLVFQRLPLDLMPSLTLLAV